MPRGKELAITEKQFQVLSLLWEHGALTVRELLEHLDSTAELPYTTVLGLLQNMERAGLVRHAVENQAHRYSATRSKDEGTGLLLTDFVKRFFRGSAEKLVLGLVDSEQLSPRELQQIQTQLYKAAPPLRQKKSTPRKRRKS